MDQPLVSQRQAAKQLGVPYPTLGVLRQTLGIETRKLPSNGRGLGYTPHEVELMRAALYRRHAINVPA